MDYVKEIQLTYLPDKRFSELVQIKSSTDAVNFFRKVWAETMSYEESVYVACLNRANRVTSWKRITIGGDTGCIVPIKAICQVALKTHACSIILAHNHPSGNTTPSEQDKLATKRLAEAMKILEMQLLDHVILTEESSFSFMDEGMI